MDLWGNESKAPIANPFSVHLKLVCNARYFYFNEVYIEVYMGSEV